VGWKGNRDGQSWGEHADGGREKAGPLRRRAVGRNEGVTKIRKTQPNPRRTMLVRQAFALRKLNEKWKNAKDEGPKDLF